MNINLTHIIITTKVKATSKQVVNTPANMNIYEALQHAKKVYDEHGIFSGKFRYSGIDVPFCKYSSYSDIETVYHLLKEIAHLKSEAIAA